MRQAADWLDFYRRFWEESFDRLEEYLQRVQNQQQTGTRKNGTRKPAIRNGSNGNGKQAKSGHSNKREN